MPIKELSAETDNAALLTQATEEEACSSTDKGVVGEDSNSKLEPVGSTDHVIESKQGVPQVKKNKTHRILTWTQIRPSLCAIEDMMSARVKKSNAKSELNNGTGKLLLHANDARPAKGGFEEDSEEEFYDVERSEPSQDVPLTDSVPPTSAAGDVAPSETSTPWKEELACLVRGGVPMALRGEVDYKTLGSLIVIGFYCLSNLTCDL